MTRRRATLKDRRQKKGRGVTAFFENEDGTVQLPAGETRKTATFNLPLNKLDFLDTFVLGGKQRFRHWEKVSVGAINKSAVLEELLNVLEGDDRLKEKVLAALVRKQRKEGSRHDPRKTLLESNNASEGDGATE